MYRATNNKNRIVAATALAAVLTGCGEQVHEFRLLEPALPIDQEIAAELVEVFAKHSDHSVTLVPIPDTAEAPLDAIESGYADLALASNAQRFREGVTTVMPLYPTVLHILYKRERDTSDLRSLFQGADVYAGPVGSSSRQLMTAVLEDMDMDEQDVSFVVDAVELFDVIVLYMPISPERVNARLETLGAEGIYQLLSFGAPQDIGTGSVIDRAVLLDPRLSPFVIPVGTYGDVTPEPVVTVAVDKMLVANSELPDTAVYDLINEIRRLQPALASNHPLLFDHLGDEFAASDSTFVLHPGAQAFTQRDAPNFYERYSGVAEVLVTLVIGVISGVYAVAQIYQRRRKNRIDTFYTDVIAIRDSITASSTPDELTAAIEQVRKLQNNAFAMLVDEKVAADESFRIFITLSNDVIAEFGSAA
jgi:TRAP-type uncharacterized transport system substrate-binding protein